MNQQTKPSLVGINHVALEVGNVNEALDFYRKIFRFEMRGGDFTAEERAGRPAFIDLGDQFLALMEGRTQAPDDHRHFGLVVDDRSHIADLAAAAGARMLEGPNVEFLDPWGNRIQIVEYRDIQFAKTDSVQRAMGLELEKSEDARRQMREKGIT